MVCLQKIQPQHLPRVPLSKPSEERNAKIASAWFVIAFIACAVGVAQFDAVRDHWRNNGFLSLQSGTIHLLFDQVNKSPGQKQKKLSLAPWWSLVELRPTASSGRRVELPRVKSAFMCQCIWICLKMGYTPNYSHLIGIMIINHWV